MSKNIALKTKNEFHFARKIWHVLGVLSLFVLLFSLGFDRNFQILLVSVFFGFILLLEVLRLNFKKVNLFCLRTLGFLMREEERERFSGALPLFLGILIILVLFPIEIVKLSFLFLAFSDPLASFAGLRFGKVKILKNKTLEGSLVCWTCCFFLTFWFFPIESPHFSRTLICVLSGLVGAVSELVGVAGLNDNLTIPIFSSLGLWLLTYGSFL